MGSPRREIGRAETAQRRALQKSLKTALKRQAMHSKWSTAQSALFRSFNGWFLSAPLHVRLDQRKTRVELSCKPMALDPLFWDIVHAESNDQLPLSFRYTGAWTCHTPPVVGYDLPEEPWDPDAQVAEALAWLDAQTGQFRSWTLEMFLQQIQQHPRAKSYRATIITTLFLSGDYAAGAALCDEAIALGDECGFSVSCESEASQSFPQMAREWLSHRRAGFH